jgi:hypothetical protein
MITRKFPSRDARAGAIPRRHASILSGFALPFCRVVYAFTAISCLLYFLGTMPLYISADALQYYGSSWHRPRTSVACCMCMCMCMRHMALLTSNCTTCAPPHSGPAYLHLSIRRLNAHRDGPNGSLVEPACANF